MLTSLGQENQRHECTYTQGAAKTKEKDFHGYFTCTYISIFFSYLNFSSNNFSFLLKTIIK